MPSSPKAVKPIVPGRILIGLVILVCFVLATVLVKQTLQIMSSDYIWLAAGPNNQFVIKAITTSKQCPIAQINHQSIPMKVRAAQDSQIKVTSCELELPNDASSVSVKGQSLLVPTQHPKRIVVIGDTGCRLKGDRDQSCDNPTDWPFAQVAQSAADFNPDLVIHVGDYLYRESKCPAGDAGCRGSVWGYNFPTLQADFFTPAKPLLTKAPWVFIRGNHETCKRAGDLWFRYLDTAPYDPNCQQFSNPNLVSFENLQLLTLDSSSASDFQIKPEEVAQYQAQFRGLTDLADNLWLVTHRPLFGIKVNEAEDEEEHDESTQLPEDQNQVRVNYFDDQKPAQDLVLFNQTLQAAIPSELQKSLDLSLSGHYHNFEMLSFDGQLPPQLIAGNAATELEAEITAPLDGLLIKNTEVTSSKFWHNFGYLTMEENTDGSWTAIERDPAGNAIFTCLIKNRNITCH